MGPRGFFRKARFDSSTTMWNLVDGERVLTKHEWRCIQIGLEWLREYIISDPEDQYGFARTGVEMFDRLSSTQKLAILADTCEALTLPSVAAPN